MNTRSEPLMIGAAAAVVLGGVGILFFADTSIVSAPGSAGAGKGHPGPVIPKASSAGPLPGEDARPVQVIKTYSGVCSMVPKDDDDWIGQMTIFPIYHPDDFENELVRYIPEHLPSEAGPAPENPDPLLENPKLDLGKNMALVLLHPDTLSANPIVRSIREDATTLWVDSELPDKPPGESCPEGMGAYTVVIFPFSGEPKHIR